MVPWNRRNAKEEIFLEREERRDIATLNELICRHVAPGSIIYTDGWGGYRGLVGANMPFDGHETVNHSRNFVNPVNSEVHSQNVENLWKWLHFLRTKGTNLPNLEVYLADQQCFPKLQVLPRSRLPSHCMIH